jgi:hypothetical protein
MEMGVIALLFLARNPMVFPDPGMSRVFMHAKGPRGLGHRLLRLDRSLHRALLEGSGILSRCGLTPRTHLIRCMLALSPCVRKSIATST